VSRIAGVYRFTDLPSATQAKNPTLWILSDLQPGDQPEAASRDICGIVDGTKVIVMSPTGNVASALSAVRIERGIKGI